MSEEILINVTPHETRVAVVENGLLQDIYIERTRKRGLVGNIIKGQVVRILPGMQAAFINIGLERSGFLHISDLVEMREGSEIGPEQRAPGESAIETLLTDRQKIVVQVMKDPLGSKGARLTTRIAIPSRYLVFLPYRPGIRISRRIEDEQERERLRQVITQYQGQMGQCTAGNDGQVMRAKANQQAPIWPKGGFIVRTAAEGVAAEEIHKDMDFLHRLWESISAKEKSTPAPGPIYEDLPLVMRTLRDLVHDGIEKIRIDSKATYSDVLAFSEQCMPALSARIEHYPGERPILDLYAVEDELQKSLNRRVKLKSGGDLIIDQTEAMTTIDVNTGAFVGHRDPKETIYKTNLEAAQVIARQLRLRNLGGMIIIDFIDMREPEHARQVLRSLEKHIDKDHARVIMSELTSLGLVQLTRKRTRKSLEDLLCEPCPTCHARGSVKTPQTVCYEIFREVLREVRQFDAQKLLVVAAQKVVDRLMDEEASSVVELEGFIGRPVSFQVEPHYTQEQYDIILL